MSKVIRGRAPGVVVHRLVGIHPGGSVRSRSVISSTVAAAIASLLVAAAPAPAPAPASQGAVEIEDGCGDTGSHVMGEEVAHPTPPATDVDTVDLRGRYADDELRTLTGLEVEVVTCGDPMDVASGESITVGWEAPADRLDGCDRSTVSVTVSRSVEDGSWSGSLVRHCVVDSDDCTLPFGIGGACATATYNEMVSVDLPPEAVVIDGRSFTFVLDRAELPDAAAGFLVDGDVFTRLWVFGSSFAGTNLSTGAEDGDGTGAWVSLVERGEGSDHELGGDRPT